MIKSWRHRAGEGAAADHSTGKVPPPPPLPGTMESFTSTNHHAEVELLITLTDPPEDRKIAGKKVKLSFPSPSEIAVSVCGKEILRHKLFAAVDTDDGMSMWSWPHRDDQEVLKIDLTKAVAAVWPKTTCFEDPQPAVSASGGAADVGATPPDAPQVGKIRAEPLSTRQRTRARCCARDTRCLIIARRPAPRHLVRGCGLVQCSATARARRTNPPTPPAPAAQPL